MLQLFLLFVVAVSAQTVPKVASYKGYEFSFYTNEASGKLTYDDAKQVCVDAGARLAEIKSADVQDFITTQLTDLGLVESWTSWNQGYWIGGVCGGGGSAGGINNWKWEDGTSMGGSNYQNWYDGCGITDPNSNFASSRAYVYPFETNPLCTGFLGTWGDDDMGNIKKWICMKEICASNPCQNNGTCVPQSGNYSCLCAGGVVGANCEIDLCDPSPCENSGTCVRKFGGKFSCDCEPAYNGTLCENANYESSENVDYLLHINYNSFSTFSRSSEDCKLNGQSDLVIIKDKETQKNIENKAIELYGQGSKEFWIGAERKYTGWFWLDGSQLTFTNWGETGNDGAGNCLKMVSQSGNTQLQWIAGQCEEQLGYICEKPANKIDPCMETKCLNSGTCFSSGSHFNCQCVAGFKGVNCEVKISDPTIAILASIIGVLALVIIILIVAFVYMRRKGISPKHVQSIKSKQPSGELRNPTEGDYLEINETGQTISAQHIVMAQQSQYVNDGISGLENETCDTTKYPPTNTTSTTDNHQYEEISHKCR